MVLIVYPKPYLIYGLIRYLLFNSMCKYERMRDDQKIKLFLWLRENEY